MPVFTCNNCGSYGYGFVELVEPASVLCPDCLRNLFQSLKQREVHFERMVDYLCRVLDELGPASCRGGWRKQAENRAKVFRAVDDCQALMDDIKKGAEVCTYDHSLACDLASYPSGSCGMQDAADPAASAKSCGYARPLP